MSCVPFSRSMSQLRPITGWLDCPKPVRGVNMLSEKARTSLQDAGWHQGRNIDVSVYENAYIAKRYPLQECTLRFLREFGGLSLKYPHFRDKAAMDGCNFRAEEACAWERVWVREYEEHVGETLVPVGYAFSDHMLLVMSDKGHIFACFEDLVCLVGVSGEAAINALCEGRELECTHIEECESVPVASDFTDAVRQRLTSAGWTEGRSVEVASKISALTQDGFVTSDEGRTFLQEFVGLRIRTEVGGEFDVNPLAAMTMLGSSQAREVSARLGVQEVTPIGVAHPGNIVVIIDDRGRMFGTLPRIPDWLVKFGDTRVAGLNAIVSGTGAT